ncbi:MAG: acyltransferase [Gammaproteobacteria bacterium]|nr:acyltransferase [Gammaproteobacteria bacterium]
MAATMVLVSHHFALTGQMEPTFFGVHSLGGLAVTIFFVISGYLVTASWQRDPNLWRFALRRFLRIWPALTVVLVLTAYGLGAWVTELPLLEYLRHGATTNYLHGLWMQIHFVLPGVFAHNPYPLGVNGSLWTIPIEVRCYVALGLAGLLGLLKYRPVFLLGIALFMVWFLSSSNADVTGAVHYGRELSAFFLAGAALQCGESHWNRRPALWAAVLGAACVATWAIGWRHTALLIGLPFFILYAGTRATPFIRRAGRWGDPSYGIYLLAFPIQQTVILYLWPEAGFAGTMALALALTVALAYVSWHLIEKQALKFKPSSKKSTLQALRTHKLAIRLKQQSAHLLWPLLAAMVGLRFIITGLDAPVLPDPANTYLPAARAFLEQGWSFLLTPQSYYVAPLAYLWPALWGADPTWIRIANMGLWIGCVVFLWRTCHMLGGARASAFAMLLLLSPELVRYFPTEMTEPLYLFGIFGWMHAMGRILIQGERSTAVVMQAAFMLAVTLLSRPVLQLVAPVAFLACLGCMVYWSIPKNKAIGSDWQQQVPAVAWSLGLALALPLALVIKNGVLFGFWSLGTGSGIGLYLGTHPLYQGAEPEFLGFGFDINTMVAVAAQADSPLSLAGDRAARQAAIWHIQSMPLADALAFFGRKLWWWLAHHPAPIETFGGSLRKLRFFELLVILTSITWLAHGWRRRFKPTHSPVSPRQLAFAAFLLAMFLVMLAQLLPVLYNSRYSSGLLDPWLIPLTAFGLASLTASIQFRGALQNDCWSVGLVSGPGVRIWPAITALGLILLATFAGYKFAHKHESIAVDPLHMGQTLSYLDISEASRVETYGMDSQGTSTWAITKSPAVLEMRLDAKDIQHVTDANLFNALWETQVALQGNGKRCGKAEVAYHIADGRFMQPGHKLPLLLPLQADGAFRRLLTHANHELRPREPGSLRIVLHCPVGTIVTWRGTRLLESRHAWDAAAHIPH